MNKFLNIFSLIISIVAIIFSCLVFFNKDNIKVEETKIIQSEETTIEETLDINDYPPEPEEDDDIIEDDVSYKIYISMTDKNENKKVLTDKQALDILARACITNNVGYTTYITYGGYKDKTGKIVSEDAFVLELINITDETLYKILNEIEKEMNTGTVMIQKNKADIFFYTISSHKKRDLEQLIKDLNEE